MKYFTFTLILLIFSPSLLAQEPGAFPKSFFGVWDASAELCRKRVSDGRLKIQDGVIKYWDSQGEVLTLRKITPLHIKVKLAMSGGGEQWMRTRSFVLSKDLNKLTERFNGGSFSLVRCNK